VPAKYWDTDKPIVNVGGEDRPLGDFVDLTTPSLLKGLD
jgi:hypothetical protein